MFMIYACINITVWDKIILSWDESGYFLHTFNAQGYGAMFFAL